MSDSQLDFSVQNMPQSWIDASADAPQPETMQTRNKKKQKNTLIGRAKMDAFGASVGAIASALLMGATWFYLDGQGQLQGPWTPVVYGALIGICVRLGGGREEPSQRASLAISVYVLGVAATLFMIYRAKLQASTPGYDWGHIERSLFRGYVSDPINAMGLVLGGIAAGALNALSRVRH